MTEYYVPGIYIAPRSGTRPQGNRVKRQASCGHDVWLSERGVDAVDRREKRLVCGPCFEAQCHEHGGRMGVIDQQI